MKVKVFEKVVNITPHSTSGKLGLNAVEDQINTFLDENPGIEVLDIKLSSHAAMVGNVVANFVVLAVVLYRGAGA